MLPAGRKPVGTLCKALLLSPTRCDVARNYTSLPLSSKKESSRHDCSERTDASVMLLPHIQLFRNTMNGRLPRKRNASGVAHTQSGITDICPLLAIFGHTHH